MNDKARDPATGVTMRCDRVWYNARLLTMAEAPPGLGVVEDGVVAAHGGRIVYAGPAADAPAALDAEERIDFDGRWIIPGLIDCHTHLVHAGDRSHEFELRLRGATYEEIARAGGGILSTMRATRAASRGRPRRRGPPAARRPDRRRRDHGRVKSGYGLDLDTELKQLRAARRWPGSAPVDVRTTFLGLHAVPPEFAGDRDAYIDLVCREMIPAVAAGRAWQRRSTRSVKASASRPSRPAACSRRRGPRAWPQAPRRPVVEPRTGRRSRRVSAPCRPIIWNTPTRPASRRWRRPASSRSLLPGAFYFLRETRAPRSRLFRRHGVPMALATDCNPGTSPLTSLLLTMNMAATLFGLTVDECLAGVTREAARALGGSTGVGTLEAGKFCDLAIWDIDRPAELVYRIGLQPAASPASGEDNDVILIRPGAIDARGLARHLSRRRADARPGAAAPRSAAAPKPSSGSWPAASRSMASTPALANWPASGSRPATSRRCSATSCCRTPPAWASRCPRRSSG